MDTFTILFLIGAALILPLMIYIATNRAKVGSPLIAGALSLAFGLFTLFTIMREGLEQVVFNHNINFWGTQVWYDLVMAVTVALFFVVPRARSRNEHHPLGRVRGSDRQRRLTGDGRAPVLAGASSAAGITAP